MILFFTILSVLSMNYNVKWSDSYVEIPLGASIYDYIEIPKAQLYNNGVLVSNPTIHYERNGIDQTFLSVVHTRHVKEHRIVFRATFPKHNNFKSKHAIIFSVVDKIPPSIDFVPENKVPVFTKKLDLLKDFKFHDNYYENDKCDVSVINEELINYSMPGEYKIFYQVIDGSNNVTTIESKVIIYDDIMPQIALKKPIVLEYNKTFNYHDYFNISDNYSISEKLKINFIDDKVNYNEIGLFTLEVTVEDESQNIAKFITSVKIIDSVPPILVLTTKVVPLTIFDKSYKNKLLNYVLEVSDNFDDLLRKDIIIIEHIQIDMIGTYEIYYQVKDTSENETKKKLTIEVVDNVKPTIENVKELIFDVGISSPFYESFFEIADNYDDYYELKINYTGAINYNKIGSYDFKVDIVDLSKNKISWIGQVTVVDRISPEIIQLDDIYLTSPVIIDFSVYFEVVDNYDKEVQYEIDYSQVNYEIVGKYDLVITAKDSSENSNEKVFTIYVIDVTPPVLIIQETTSVIQLGEEYDLFMYIFLVEDDFDVLSTNDVEVISEIDNTIIGKYRVRYKIRDKTGNEKVVEIVIYVDDLIPPVITAPILYVSKSEIPNILQDVHAHDNYDGDITGEIVILSKPDFQIPGKKYICYQVSDSRGNTTIYNREVNVELVSQIDYLSILPYLLVILGLSIGNFYIFRKRQ